jgi:hypothetical protein
LPNILANFAFNRRGLLQRSAVLFTRNVRESLEPANRLYALLNEGCAQGVEVGRRQVPVEETLQAVTDAMTLLFEEFPDVRWILNATGGNKMMSAALLVLAGSPQVAAVIYRDIVHGWREVQWYAGGGLHETPVSADHALLGCLVAPDLRLDSLPLDLLIRAQFAAGDAIERFASRAIPPQAEPAAWLDAATHGRRAGFANCEFWLDEAQEEGRAFECWLGTLLRAAGARQVLWSCEGLSPGGQKVIETDLMALHGDRIALYDVKLQSPDAPGKSDQIRSVRATADKLGGLSAAAVLLRPNWPATPHVVKFAEALKVSLIHRGNAHDLVRLLCEPLGLLALVVAQPSLQHVARRLTDLARARGPVLFGHR